jgi:SpoIID/LytB domain protein
MGNPVNVKVKVNGNYSIPENKDIYLERNKEYEIGIQDGKLIFKDGNAVYTLGNRFTFKQHKGGDSDVLSVLNPSYGWTNYKGDMVVSLEGGYIRLTNHVYLETYLYGVLPYEMSNKWPLEALKEALKAQAVAARTYAVRCKKSASAAYDVVDTQGDQVYRGYNPGYGNCIRTVDETAKMVLKYNGGFVPTFYSSSNGGWIEAGYEVFSSVPKGFKPLSAKEDPYDPKSQWSFVIHKTQIDIGGNDPANPDSWWSSVIEKDAGSYKNFIEKLKEEIKKNTGALDVKIVSIDEMRFEGETAGKRKREAYFKLLFYMKDGNGYVMDDQGKIKLNIAEIKMPAKDMRSAVGASIMKSLYITGLELSNAGTPGQEKYVISGLGFGHGVGMSQYGAKAMAEQNKNYQEILKFYYPEASIEALNISPPALTDMPSRGDDRQDPQPPGGGSGQPQPVYGVVKVTTSLNVRQGPGTQYKRIGGLGPNARVQILRQVGDWYEIKAGNLQGYIHSDYIVLEGGQQPPGSSSGGNQGQQPPVDPPVPPSNERKYAVVTASALNVRSGPSTRNHKIGMVVKGNKLTVLEKAGEWYKIEYNGLTGYVHGDYIKLESASAQPPSGGSIQPPSTNNGNVMAQGTVTASMLNVRSGAGTGFRAIGKLARNAKVDILEKVGAWYKIKYGGTVGYVHGDYIRLGSSDTGSRGEQPASVGIVAASGLNVRSGPGTNYSKIGFLYRNSQVTILGQTGAWYKIKFGSTTGYVHSAYVKVSNAVPSRGEDDRSLPSTAVVTATWLNVRTGPGTNYTRIGAIKMNSRVTILQKVGSWYKISYGALTGYVSGDYLKF